MEDTLGSRIQRLLDQKGISRKEFSEMTSLTEAAISRYINNQREPKAITLSIMANALGVSVDTLLGTRCDDPAVLSGAVELVARNANDVSPEEKKKLIEALLRYL